ncbi:MAG TPA: helix-turn-helix domain-containing protein, partial [Candidatus Avacidaminococcus intestinavium]|nr:helix-turn-helix domain-containing protein [Candidatus Avacidaminococcus intestinavium]
MSSIGEILKNAREAKGISIQQVADATSIRVLYLEAIEAEQFTVVPGEVYLKGFIRNYGNFLGMDGAALVELYKEQVKAQEPEQIAQEVEDAVSVNTLRNKRREKKRELKIETMPIIKIVLALVVIGSIIYFAFSFFKGSGKTALEHTSSQQTVQEVPLAKIQEVTPIKVTQTSDGTYLVQGADTISIALEATGDCWTEVHADGQEVYVGMVSKGQMKKWSAKQNLEVLLGNVRA